jgi:hypothetical protein
MKTHKLEPRVAVDGFPLPGFQARIQNLEWNHESLENHGEED